MNDDDYSLEVLTVLRSYHMREVITEVQARTLLGALPVAVLAQGSLRLARFLYRFGLNYFASSPETLAEQLQEILREEDDLSSDGHTCHHVAGERIPLQVSLVRDQPWPPDDRRPAWITNHVRKLKARKDCVVCGDHVHFEIRTNKSSIPPGAYIPGGPRFPSPLWMPCHLRCFRQWWVEPGEKDIFSNDEPASLRTWRKPPRGWFPADGPGASLLGRMGHEERAVGTLELRAV